MKRGRSGHVGAVLLLVVLGVPRQPAPASGERLWRIDTTRSRLVVHVFRKGLFSPALHDHHFVPDRWSGTIRFDPDRPDDVAVEVAVDATSLRDEQPKLSPADRREVEAQVRSPRFLDADRYPQIRFVADRVEGVDRPATPPARALQGRLVGRLTIRGVTAPIVLAVTAEIGSEWLRATAETSFRQSQFGIRPLSRFLGTIGVEDRVQVELSLEAVRTEPPAASVVPRDQRSGG